MIWVKVSNPQYECDAFHSLDGKWRVYQIDPKGAWHVRTRHKALGLGKKNVYYGVFLERDIAMKTAATLDFGWWA